MNLPAIGPSAEKKPIRLVYAYTRVVLPDLQGFFERIPFISPLPKAKTLIIEPGTRAMLIDDGMFIGEVPPGAYTLEEFVQRLQFWRNKQATAFLVRCEDATFDSVMNSVPYQNHVVFKLHFRWSVQIADIPTSKITKQLCSFTAVD